MIAAPRSRPRARFAYDLSDQGNRTSSRRRAMTNSGNEGGSEMFLTIAEAMKREARVVEHHDGFRVAREGGSSTRRKAERSRSCISSRTNAGTRRFGTAPEVENRNGAANMKRKHGRTTLFGGTGSRWTRRRRNWPGRTFARNSVSRGTWNQCNLRCKRQNGAARRCRITAAAAVTQYTAVHPARWYLIQKGK